MELKSLNTSSGLINPFKLGSITASTQDAAIDQGDNKVTETNSNWLNSVEGILQTGQKIASQFLHKDPGATAPAPEPMPISKNNTGLYIGLGVGAVILIVAVVLISRKK